MNRRALQLVALGGLLTVGAQLQAHHAVAGVYDLNKEIVLEGQLTKLNFVNPHASLHLAVPNADGTTTELFGAVYPRTLPGTTTSLAIKSSISSSNNRTARATWCAEGD